MAKQYTTMSLEAVKLLCATINKTVDLPSTVISDTSIATNTTYSSFRLDKEFTTLEDELKHYTDTAIAGLNKLTKEIINDKSLVVKDNVLYLYKAADDPSNDYMQMMLINGVAVELGSTQVDMSDYYNKADSDNKFAAKLDLDTLTATVNDKVNKTDIVDNLTSTDTDKPLSANQGKVLKDEVDLKANDSDVVKKTDIVTTIDGSSTNETIPTAKAVNELNLRGTLIDQSVVDKYGTEIIKYPLGRWCIDGNDIAVKFSDIPWGTACIIDITSIIGTRNPWDTKWSYRNYKAQTIEKKGTFVRQLESRGTPGVLIDTGWQKVCTTSVADVPWTNATATSVLTRGTIKYRVKNGICYVTMVDVISADMATPSQIIVTGLPKPEYSAWHSIESNASSASSPSQNLLVRVNEDGSLTNHNATNNVSYFGSFSYPVAES